MDILSFGLESAYQGDAPGGVLERNLQALARTCPSVCARIRETPARTDIEFIETDEDAKSARLLGDGDSGRLLASARRPPGRIDKLEAQVLLSRSALAGRLEQVLADIYPDHPCRRIARCERERHFACAAAALQSPLS